MKIIEDRDVYVLNEFLKRLLAKNVLHQKELDVICKSGNSDYYYEDGYWQSLYFILIESGVVTESVQIGFVKPNKNTLAYYKGNYFGNLADKQRNDDSKYKLEMDKLRLEVNKLSSEIWKHKWGFPMSIIAMIVSILAIILQALALLPK